MPIALLLDTTGNILSLSSFISPIGHLCMLIRFPHEHSRSPRQAAPVPAQSAVDAVACGAGEVPELGKPQGSAEVGARSNCGQEPHTSKRNPWGALGTRAGRQGLVCQPGRVVAVCMAGCCNLAGLNRAPWYLSGRRLCLQLTRLPRQSFHGNMLLPSRQAAGCAPLRYQSTGILPSLGQTCQADKTRDMEDSLSPLPSRFKGQRRTSLLNQWWALGPPEPTVGRP